VETFTEVYDKSASVLRNGSLDPSWKDIESALSALLDGIAPNPARAPVLDTMREHLRQCGAGKSCVGTAAAEEIVRAARAGTFGFQDRAALIKTMKHLYLVGRRAGQSIWVADAPRSYAAFSYDQLGQKHEVDIKAELGHEDEVFGSGNREMMAEALQLAHKWAGDVLIKLSLGSDDALRDVRRWFHAPDAPDAEVEKSRAVLASGFEKMYRACNGSSVVFADQPECRTSGDWNEAYAAVTHEDRMPVIYIFRVFLEKGRRNALGEIPLLWECALTILHELSHKLMHTIDIQYEFEGLNPIKMMAKGAPLENAESWAYFAGALVGAIPKPTLNRVLR
jgi:hypothetical protein